jgi:hypothetical protein
MLTKHLGLHCTLRRITYYIPVESNDQSWPGGMRYQIFITAEQSGAERSYYPLDAYPRRCCIHIAARS